MYRSYICFVDYSHPQEPEENDYLKNSVEEDWKLNLKKKVPCQKDTEYQYSN
jgi:hypothetical protein